MSLGIPRMRSLGFNADLSRCVVVVTLAVLFLCAPTIASTLLKSRPGVGDFSSSASKSASTLIKGRPRSNDFSRSASKSDTSSDSSIADEWDDVFDTARSVLAKLPDPARIETTIKDPALRRSVLRAYQSLKTFAKVSRDQNRSTKQGMLAQTCVRAKQRKDRGLSDVRRVHRRLARCVFFL